MEKEKIYQVSVCQVGWVLLEYTRTAMFHWMFLEVVHHHHQHHRHHHHRHRAP